MSTRSFGARIERNIDPKLLRGEGAFVDDIPLANPLHVAFLRSPHAHARIRAIDTSRAEALPGVKAVVTGADFPTLESLIVAVGESAGNIVHASAKCMAKDKVLHEGQPVAAVAATTQAIAQEALALIAVDYEVLPHVLDIEAALAPDAPVLHDTVFTKGVDPSGAVRAADRAAQLIRIAHPDFREQLTEEGQRYGWLPRNTFALSR